MNIVKNNPNHIILQQFANPANLEAHRSTTAEEILSKETVWAELTMETKVSVLEGRVYIEEFVQAFETHAQDEIEKSFSFCL